MHIHIDPCMHACMHAYVHAYIHTCRHSHVHTHTQTYIHTYIHTRHACILTQHNIHTAYSHPPKGNLEGPCRQARLHHPPARVGLSTGIVLFRFRVSGAGIAQSDRRRERKRWDSAEMAEPGMAQGRRGQTQGRRRQSAGTAPNIHLKPPNPKNPSPN